MAMAPVNSIRRWDFNIGQFPLDLPLISANRRIAELAISTSALQSTAVRRHFCCFEKKMHRWKAKILLFRTSKKLQTFSPKSTLETRKKTHAPNLSVQPGRRSEERWRVSLALVRLVVLKAKVPLELTRPCMPAGPLATPPPSPVKRVPTTRTEAVSELPPGDCRGSK